MSKADRLAKYEVYLTHSDERPIGISFSEGRYGFRVRASSIDEAARLAIERAQQDGFWGYDWRAMISLLDDCGRVTEDAYVGRRHAHRVIRLHPDGDDEDLMWQQIHAEAEACAREVEEENARIDARMAREMAAAGLRR